MSLVQFDSWHFCSSSLDYLFIYLFFYHLSEIGAMSRAFLLCRHTYAFGVFASGHDTSGSTRWFKKRRNETPARITEEWMKSALQELLSNSSWLSDIAGGSFLMGCLQRKQFADHKFGESRRDSMMTGKKTKWAFPRVKLFSLSRRHVTELWKFEAARAWNIKHQLYSLFSLVDTSITCFGVERGLSQDRSTLHSRAFLHPSLVPWASEQSVAS